MSSSRLRELRESDAAAVAALFVASYGDARQVDAAEIRSWLRNEEFEQGWLRVLDESGDVVGYGDIWPREDELALDVASPGHWDAFLDWAEDEARTRGIPRVRTNPPSAHELADICLGRGYRYRRSSLTMEIVLDAPPNVDVPDGFELRTYRESDAEVVRSTLNDAFALDPFWHHVTASNFDEFYLRARGFDPELWQLAWLGEELAGTALGYAQRGSDESLGWVGTVGVREPWRRRGLGDALLRSTFRALYARGLNRIGLGVDAENITGALRLYERAGMRKVRQTDNWVLELP